MRLDEVELRGEAKFSWLDGLDTCPDLGYEQR